MLAIMDDSTIAAVASPAGTGGISIIKISGPGSIPIAASIFQSGTKLSKGQPTPAGFDSHRLYYGHIIDDQIGRSLDEVLVSVMRAPRSYTREDVVEINCHGGAAAVRAVLELVLRKGARLADPGEFTRRAFLNGRIDLTQAEAVIDVINARTDLSLAAASAQTSGILRREIENIRRFLIEWLARNEAAIDFPEEEDVAESLIDGRILSKSLREKAILPLEQFICNYYEGRLIREGLTVAIVGRPNVGKSSLMNRLLSYERAIVTPHPGTTRDAIEADLAIQGILISLWDTAGLHQSEDPIETIGIQKTNERLAQADLVLFVLEAHRPVTTDDYSIYQKIDSKPIVLVLNKIDLIDESSPPNLIPGDWVATARTPISALSGLGIESVREAIVTFARRDGAWETAPAVLPNLRQKNLLELCIRSAQAAAASLERNESPEIVDIHLRQALDKIDETLGLSARTEIIDSIFSRFCIGK
jgi:tRNA modification GTPase